MEVHLFRLEPVELALIAGSFPADIRIDVQPESDVGLEASGRPSVDLGDLLSELPPVTVYEPDIVEIKEEPCKAEDIIVTQYDDVWVLEGEWLERLVRNVNFSDYESRMYFDRMLRGSGIFERLEEMGINEGDTVSIFDLEFEYQN